MTQRNLDLTCRHCLRNYDEDGRDYGNFNTGLCFRCFEEDQEDHTAKSLQHRRLAFLYA